MKVSIKVTVEVDPDKWMAEYGCDRDEVRRDVHDYFINQIQMAPAIEDAELTVRGN